MIILCFLLLVFIRVDGKLFLESNDANYTFLRSIRLSTNDQHFHIQCPHNFYFLSVKLLNYSNERCFNLYTSSSNNVCTNDRSSCQFHAKPVQLNCDHQSYSSTVDITYQCSSKVLLTSVIQHNALTLRGFPLATSAAYSQETVTLFLIGLICTVAFWLLVSCICFIHYHQNDEKHDLLSQTNSLEEDYININLLALRNSSTSFEDFGLHVNPFDNNQISSISLV